MSKIKSQFSLVELMTVLAICSLMMSMLMPALMHVREKTYHAQCVSNMRSMGLAFALYAAEYNDYLPHEDQGSTEAPYGSHWYDVIDPYLNVDDTFEVKQDPAMARDVIFDPDGSAFSMKFNSRLEDYQGSAPFRQVRTIRRPADTVLLFDGRLDSRGYQYKSHGMFSSVRMRHLDEANILFVDGHASMIPHLDQSDFGWANANGLIWNPDRDFSEQSP